MATSTQATKPDPTPARHQAATMVRVRSNSLALAAAVFGVLSFAASLAVHPPMPEQPGPSILHWYATHQHVVETSELLMAVALLAFLWVVAEIRHAVPDGATPVTMASVVLQTFGGCGVVLFIAGTWMPLALAVSADRGTDAPSPAVVHLVSDVTWFHYASQDLVFGAATAALALIVLHGTLGRRWIGWVAVASAITAVLGGAASFFPHRHGQLNAPTVLGWVGFLLLDVTMIALAITSGEGWSRAREAR